MFLLKPWRKGNCQTSVWINLPASRLNTRIWLQFVIWIIQILRPSNLGSHVIGTPWRFEDALKTCSRTGDMWLGERPGPQRTGSMKNWRWRFLVFSQPVRFASSSWTYYVSQRWWSQITKTWNSQADKLTELEAHAGTWIPAGRLMN